VIARGLSVIYCDDIRQEMGSKMSYMGVYSTKLLVPAFPIVLPRLAIALTAVTPIQTPFKQLTFRIFKDKEIAFETAVNAEILDRQAVEGQCHVLGFITILSPLALEGPCVIRVRAITEDGELAAPALEIESASMTQPAAK